MLPSPPPSPPTCRESHLRVCLRTASQSSSDPALLSPVHMFKMQRPPGQLSITCRASFRPPSPPPRCVGPESPGAPPPQRVAADSDPSQQIRRSHLPSSNLNPREPRWLSGDDFRREPVQTTQGAELGSVLHNLRPGLGRGVCSDRGTVVGELGVQHRVVERGAGLHNLVLQRDLGPASVTAWSADHRRPGNKTLSTPIHLSKP